MHTLGFRATDNAGNSTAPQIVTFEILASPSEEPTPTPEPVVDLPDGVFRVAGPDRYATSAAASRRAFPYGADVVVIATGTDWPDALGGAALAGAVGGPLLLTAPSSLPASVTAEFERLGATHAYMLGGTGAVSEQVFSQLIARFGADGVERVAGADRFATARAVAERVIELQGDAYDGGAIVATGLAYPDALAASPLAAARAWPVLLADPRVASALALPPRVTDVLIAGGTAAVPDGLESALAASLGPEHVARAAGATRYETAALLAEAAVENGLSWDGVGVATGEGFADALSGGAMLGSVGAPLLFTRPNELLPAVESTLRMHSSDIGTVHVLGGDGAVGQDVVDSIRSLLDEEG